MSRPRRSAAVKAESSMRIMADSPDPVTMPVSPSKTRRGAAARASPAYAAVEARRSRTGKRSYVVDSTEDSEEPDDEDDLDAEGEEDEDLDDADGDVDMEVMPQPSRRSAMAKAIPRSAPLPVDDDDDDDDDELSDTNMEETGFGYETAEEDAEGEEDDDADVPRAPRTATTTDLADSEDEFGESVDNMDVSRMTKRQRARFADEEDDGSYLKLSDEVQVKKHLTAEELSMRRTEMARRRRNLSDKRTEEVKMETINKLLKKQAPKTNKKAKTAEEEAAEEEARRPDPTLIRWVSSKDGITLSVPDAILEGPLNEAFKDTMKPSGRKALIEEVS